MITRGRNGRWRLTTSAIAVVDDNISRDAMCYTLEGGIPDGAEGYALKCQDEPDGGRDEVDDHGCVEEVGVALFDLDDA